MITGTFVRLKITSLLHDPEYISKSIGISCDRGWKIGEKRLQTVIEEKTNGWILNSGLDKASPLEQQITALMTRIGTAGIKEKLAEEKIEVSCVVYTESVPSLNFSAETIAQIQRLGASLDIDLYLPDRLELPSQSKIF